MPAAFSDLVVGAEALSLVGADELSPFESLLDSLLDSLDDEGALLRLSVMYQPLPLKITPTGWNTLRIGPYPQLTHSVSGSAVTGCIFSNRSPHS